MAKRYVLLAFLSSVLLFTGTAHAFGRAKPTEPTPVPTVVPTPFPIPSPTPSPKPSPTVSPKPTPSPTASPAPPTTQYPQVISGWLDQYTSHIEEVVSGSYPGLLSLPASRMAVVCPSWDQLDRGGREKFWSSLLWSVAGPESARNRTSMYVETTMGSDPITGQQVTSEGLLQLSYQDVPNYKYTGSDVSWDKDRTMALEDYALKKKTGNPERTLLNAYANLNLGLWIMDRRIEVATPTGNIETTLGKYWSTMRSTNATFKTVLSNLKTRMPACFQ